VKRVQLATCFNGHKHVLATVLAALVLTAVTTTAAHAQAGTSAEARGLQAQQLGLLAELGQDTTVTVVRAPQTNWVRWLSAGAGKGGFTTRAAGNATPVESALAFANHYGPLFGLRQNGAQFTVLKNRTKGGRSHVRLQQTYNSVPVIGGELIVQLNAARKVETAISEVAPAVTVDTTPKISAAQASSIALQRLGRDLKLTGLTASTPNLWIYQPGLIGPTDSATKLVWRLVVKHPKRLTVNYFVLIDAHRGTVSLKFNQTAHARTRRVHDAECRDTLPGALRRSEGQADTGNVDVDDAYNFGGDTYDYFFNNFGRDSIDNAGMALIQTVNYAEGSTCTFENAFWNGQQMVYGKGFASADDVVGHELSHGVTEKEAGLLYYYQAGALNESFSDIFGEFVDLSNNRGTDTAAVRWKIGEDLPIGAIRDMKSPLLYQQPDKMSSPAWNCDYFSDPFGDAGGVHTNSGVGNKLAYLLTDGGTFNGKTVTALGMAKTAALFYEANTSLLTSGADYFDLYLALRQAAINQGLTEAERANLETASQAVEVHNGALVTCVRNSEAPICDIGAPIPTYFEGFESTVSWVTQTQTGANLWGVANFYAASGTKSMYGNTDFGSPGYDAIPDDSSIAMASGVTIPANAFLHFRHAASFEAFGSFHYDGGVVEYSTDNGTTWVDADSLFEENGYNGIINEEGNPLLGRRGFIDDTHGYISSRLNLSTLAGQSVRFRFRIGTDRTLGFEGWFIDDVRIYTCADTSGPPTMSINNVTVAEGNSGNTNANFTVSLAYASTSTVTVQYATANGTSNPATAGTDYIAVPATTLTFTPGQTSKTVTIEVKGDTVTEENETFFVNLSAPTNATIADGQGLGTITNDDIVVTYRVSGRVTNPAGAGLAGVQVARTGSTTTVATDGSGNFAFPALPAGAYTITPGLPGYVFTPTSRSVTVAAAVENVNFVGASQPRIKLISPTNGATVGNFAILNAQTEGFIQSVAFSRRTSTNFTQSANLAIPDGTAVPGVLTNAKTVTGAGTIAAATLAVNITHPYISDLIVVLIAPDGTRITVHDREGADDNNIVRTYANLALAGKPLAGEWKLEISDNGASDTGTLVSWGLNLDTQWVPIANGINGPSNLWAADWHTPGTPNGLNQVRATATYAGGAISDTVNVTVNSTGVAPAPLRILGRISNHSGAGIGGVVVVRSGGGSATATATTNANGEYAFGGVLQGSYTITPQLTPAMGGATFAPASMQAVVNTSSATNINFLMTYTVRGRLANHTGAGIANVQITRVAGTSVVSTFTDADGYYLFTGVRSGSYTLAPVLTPAMTGMSFTPTSSAITVGTASLTNKNFIGMFTVSGRVVTSTNVAMANVLVRMNIGVSSTSAVTDANGYYKFTNVRSGTYTLAASQIGKTFTPVSRTATIGTLNLTNQNFIGANR